MLEREREKFTIEAVNREEKKIQIERKKSEREREEEEERKTRRGESENPKKYWCPFFPSFFPSF